MFFLLTRTNVVINIFLNKISFGNQWVFSCVDHFSFPFADQISKFLKLTSSSSMSKQATCTYSVRWIQASVASEDRPFKKSAWWFFKWFKNLNFNWLYLNRCLFNLYTGIGFLTLDALTLPKCPPPLLWCFSALHHFPCPWGFLCVWMMVISRKTLPEPKTQQVLSKNTLTPAVCSSVSKIRVDLDFHCNLEPGLRHANRHWYWDRMRKVRTREGVIKRRNDVLFFLLQVKKLVHLV